MAKSEKNQFTSIPSPSLHDSNNLRNKSTISIYSGIITLIILIMSVLLVLSTKIEITWQMASFFRKNAITIHSLANIFLCFTPLLGVVGFIYGILLLFNKDEKKAIALIGLLLNGIIIFFILIIFILLFPI